MELCVEQLPRVFQPNCFINCRFLLSPPSTRTFPPRFCVCVPLNCGLSGVQSLSSVASVLIFWSNLSLFVTLSLLVTPFIFPFHQESPMSPPFPSFLPPAPLFFFLLLLVCLDVFVRRRLTSTSYASPSRHTYAHICNAIFVRTSTFSTLLYSLNHTCTLTFSKPLNTRLYHKI